MAQQADDQAIIEATQGSTEAFSYLYSQYMERIYNYIFFRTGSQAEAEDLTARVFLRAFNHIRSYRNMGVPFSAWLYRIAHNLVANWHRDTSKRKEVPLEDQITQPHTTEFPERIIEKNQEIMQLMGAIRKLSPERQQLLILKYVEGMSNLEIAVVMGRSEGAVKSLYHRSLESLRTALLTNQADEE